MRKKYLPVFCIFVVLLFSACDSGRNQIISDLFAGPTQTPTSTVTVPTATLTPTLTPTPLPTDVPDQHLSSADFLLRIGDYDQALTEYEMIAGEIGEENTGEQLVSVEAIPAEIGIARVYYRQGKYASCLSKLNKTISQTEDKQLLGALWYQSARCSHELEQYHDEAVAYQKYLQNVPESTISDQIYEQIAYAYQNLGDYELARANFAKAAENNGVEDDQWLWLETADCYSADSDSGSAIKILVGLLDTASSDLQRASVDYRLGNEYLNLGLKDQAYARYLDAINNYPQYYDSYLSLTVLINEGQAVNDYQRGLINFYVGQYSLAAEAFHRYIKNEPNHDGSSWYFIGLCQMYLGDYEASANAYQTLIDRYPENRYYVSCWDELAYVQWYYQDNHQKASATLLSYVNRHPDQPDAAKFLYEAGRILERGNYLSEAAKQWGRLIDEYPLYENSSQALFLSAICSYRLNQLENALASLNRLLVVSAIPADQSKAHFWIAKIYEKKEDSYNRQKYFELAAKDAPSEYYSLRAEEILKGHAPMTFPENYNLSINLEQEKQVADQWMRITFSLDAGQSLNDTSHYAVNSAYQKGLELYALGEYELALDSFENVRASLEDDPLSSYSFLNQMVSYGMYRVAVFTSRQILTSAGLIENSRTLDVPNYFTHIRYGNWYADNVSSASQMYSIHPFILYGVMRQESMYDPWIVSSADARGLMQIIPSTGKEISQTLHWPPDYTEEDLNRVPVAVNFAASYLSRQKAYYDGDHFYMLASYNAGPGNTNGWVDVSQGDPDLFVEIVRYEETRNYIHNVYEFAKMYESVYAQ